MSPQGAASEGGIACHNECQLFMWAPSVPTFRPSRLLLPHPEGSALSLWPQLLVQFTSPVRAFLPSCPLPVLFLYSPCLIRQRLTCLLPDHTFPCLSSGSLRKNEKKASLCPARHQIPHTRLRAQYTEDVLSKCPSSGVPSDPGPGGHAWISLHPHTSPVWSVSLSSFHNKGCEAQRRWVDCLRSLSGARYQT